MDQKSQIHRAVKKLQKDNRLRAEVMLYFSLAVNLAYAVLQGVTGVAARSCVLLPDTQHYPLFFTAWSSENKYCSKMEKVQKQRVYYADFEFCPFRHSLYHTVYGARYYIPRIYDLRNGSLYLLYGNYSDKECNHLPKI